MIKGFSNSQKTGLKEQYVTVGAAGSSRVGAHMVPMALSKTSVSPSTISAYDSVTGQVTITSHGAVKGDILKFDSGANDYCEVEILSVVDANNILIDKRVLFGSISAGVDTAYICKAVALASDKDGNLNFQPGPTTFVQDAVTTTVTEDTANPANNKGLPSLPMFYKDGVLVSVNVDTVTPANNRLFPVELSSLAGPITVNAGDLSVSIVSTNDSVALGDGVTGNLAEVSLNSDGVTYALKVKDDDANAQLATLGTDANLLASTVNNAGSALIAPGVQVLGSDGTNNVRLKTDAAGELQIDVLSSALPTGASTLAEQQTQTTALGAIQTAVQLLDNSANVDGNPAGTAGLMIGGKDGAGDFQQVSVNASGELSVTFGSAGFATETTLAALNAKVANDYGASSGAVRTASQIGNTTGAANFNAGATGAQTLRVAANIMREGNALAYNVGAPDANTLRTASVLSDGTSTLPFGTLGASQFTAASIASLLPVLGAMLGWDGTTHRELAVTTSGALKSASQSDGGSINNGTQGASATTVSAPANCIGFMITADDGNSDNLYWAVGATASATSGQGLQPGRDTGFVPCGANVSIFGAASNPRYNIQWFTRS